MSVRNLKKLFRPESMAVIGATNKPFKMGSVVMRNLLQGGYAGPIMPVNPKHKAVAGVLAYPDIESLPMVPDCAVICTPPATIPGVIDQLGKRGTRAAIVLSSDTERMTASDGRSLREHLLEKAKEHRVRILGPNCLGLLVPGIGLNASFAHEAALTGKLAFISQSGALCTAVLDWARPKGIGFSHFISLGDSIDVDFGDVLDYLGSDPSTRAILLYIETIHQRRNFMSAARAAARNKPLLVIKAGHKAEGVEAAASHIGAIAGSDAVYDAALSRAGMLRVRDIEELFAGVQTLARSRPPRGDRLAILTNGGGIGVMAVDTLVDGGGRPAKLSPETIAKLDAVLPQAWSRSNPVDIQADASGDRYGKALAILLQATEVDATLCLYSPTAISSSSQVAEAVIAATKQNTRGVLMTCWLGSEQAEPSRKLFADAGIPTYETPTRAVTAFQHLVGYRKNQELLMEVPPSAPAEFTPDSATARALLDKALDRGETILSEPEAKGVLAAYGVPVVETHVATNPADAGRVALKLNGLVALKIHSADITYKSDVGGVMLNLEGAFEVEKAAYSMIDRVRALYPTARIEGFTVQRMARRPGALELVIGVTTDPIFGPVITFGQGGVAAEVIDDIAVALPPLNMAIARHLVEKTRVFKLLQGVRGRPPANINAICLTLIKVAQLIIDFPEIAQLDLNPLFADPEGVLALDARMTLAPPSAAVQRLAIRPYPKALEEFYDMPDGRRVLLRPIRPEDEPNHHIFVSKLNDEDIRYRFFGLIHEMPHTEMARLTQIDYDREMAFIAVTTDPEPETLGVVRTVTDPDNEKAEYAIVVRSDLKGQGLGRKLLEKMIRYCRSRETGYIVGQVLHGNLRMLGLLESLGFKRMAVIDGDVVEVQIDLQDPAVGIPKP